MYLLQIREFLMGKIASLRKPKTNIQMIQQSVLLKFKPLIVFLKEHGSEILPELRTSYTDTMSRILANHFRAYSSAVSKFQVCYFRLLLLAFGILRGVGEKEYACACISLNL